MFLFVFLTLVYTIFLFILLFFGVFSLTLERVQLSPSESNAIVESFVECARYCVVQNLAPSCNTPAEDVVPPSDKTDALSRVELVDQRSALLNYVITQQVSVIAVQFELF